jgi:hypothetical protein
MTKQAAMQTVLDEEQLMSIVYRLSAERKAQLFAFARFLAFETVQTADTDAVPLEEEIDFQDDYTASDAQWDQLLTSEKGQLALEKLADEALIDIRAGKATPMILTTTGELAPE